MELAHVEFVFINKDTSNEDINSMGVDLAEVIVSSNMAQTKSEARRHIKSGSIKINDKIVTDPFARLMLRDNAFLIIQKETT